MQTACPQHLGDLVGAVAVEATERDGAVDHCGVEADLLDETGALERDVARADAERLAGRLLEVEEIVRGDA